MHHFKPLLRENFLEVQQYSPWGANVAESACWLQGNKDFDRPTAKTASLQSPYNETC